MAILKIQDVHPQTDGEYEIDLAGLNGREAHLIKQVSGVRLGEIAEALGAGDYDVVVAIAKIVLDRAGKDVPVAALLEAPIGKITVDLTPAADEEDAERPPDSPALSGAGNEDAEPRSESEKSEPSGPASSGDGDPPPNAQSRTGDRGSEPVSASAPPILES
jgi:hypothetical protein